MTTSDIPPTDDTADGTASGAHACVDHELDSCMVTASANAAPQTGRKRRRSKGPGDALRKKKRSAAARNSRAPPGAAAGGEEEGGNGGGVGGVHDP